MMQVKQRSGPGDTGGEFIKPTLPPVTTKRKLSEVRQQKAVVASLVVCFFAARYTE